MTVSFRGLLLIGSPPSSSEINYSCAKTRYATETLCYKSFG